MNKSNIFYNPDILRIKWTNVTSNNLELIDKLNHKLVKVLDSNNWAAISPQNIVFWESKKEIDEFYKNIIILREFNWKEYFELINPEYEIIWDESVLVHELCWSIETIDSNPFWVLNLVPISINIRWINRSWNIINLTINWKDDKTIEQISFLIHEINHVNWITITDWILINKLLKWDAENYKISTKLYPELIPSYLEFDWFKYIIHNLWKTWIKKSCSNSTKKSTLPFHFHFDLEYDFDILKSKINNK